MLLNNFWRQFNEAVLATPSTPNLFNQYRDEDQENDRPGAASVRRANLRNYLAAFKELPSTLILAEAPGPWGGRFSGVPVTSEAQLLDPEMPLDGQQSSRRAKPHSEYTARIFWRELQPVFPRFLVWNTVPLHPHHAGRPLSIRKPRMREVAAFIPLLTCLLRDLQPETILAMGRTAEQALKRAGWSCQYVRHPSQGGARIFAEQVRTVFQCYLNRP